MHELKQYLIDGKLTYLNSAAGVVFDHESSLAFAEVLKQFSGNIGSDDIRSEKIKVEFDSCLEILADYFGCVSSQVCVTSGATEALSIIGRTLIDDRKKIAYCLADHPAIEGLCEDLVNYGCEVHQLSITANTDDLRMALESGVEVVIISHVHSELGVVREVSEFYRLCQEFQALLVVDFTQSIGKVDISKLDCHLGVASAQKSGGIAGLGVLVDRIGYLKQDLFFGFPSATLQRSGTINYAGFIHWIGELTRTDFAKNWVLKWSELNEFLFDGKASLEALPNCCGWIMTVRLSEEDQVKFKNRVAWSKGSACRGGVLSSAYSKCFQKPEEIIRLSF